MQQSHFNSNATAVEQKYLSNKLKNKHGTFINNKSLLALSILTALGMPHAHAGEVVECNNTDCSSNVQDVHIRSTHQNSLISKSSSSSTADPKASDSKSGNSVTLNYVESDPTNTTQPLVGNVFGAFSTDEANELTNNKAFIKSGKLVRSVFGAKSVNANVVNNSVEITGGEIGNNAVGGRSREADAVDNSVTINGGDVLQTVYGGYSYNAQAINNSVVITAGTVGGPIYGAQGEKLISKNNVNVSNISNVKEITGGYSWNGDATENVVTLDNVTVTEKVTGGYAKKSNSTDNIVNINNKSKIGDIDSWSGEVYAGYSGKGNANNNTLNVNDGTIGFYSYSGYSENGNANNNIINFISGTAGNIMYGGYSNSIGNANNNTITIDGGTAKWGVFGGHSWEGEANQNEITMNSGSAEMGLVGAKTPNNATGNIVTVNGGTIGNANTMMGPAGGVFGAKVESLGSDGSATGNATENTVNFNGGKLKVEHLIGGYTEKGEATENKANVSDGIISNNVYAGFSDSGTVDNNTATIKGGTVSGMVYGGSSKEGNANNNNVLLSDNADTFAVYGGYTDKGSATGNHVTINGGKVLAGIHGAFSSTATNNSVTMNGGVSGGLVGGFSSNKTGSDSTGNSVTITGGTVNTAVIGGSSAQGNAINNTVTIAQLNTSLNLENVTLYGGKGHNNDKDHSTGNTLNLHSKGISVKDVKNFENYNFYLNNDVKKDDTILNLRSTEETDFSNSKYGVGVEGGSSTLTADDKVILIDSAGKLKLNTDLTNTLEGKQGISTIYTFELKKEGDDKLIAQVTAPIPAPTPTPDPVVVVTPTPDPVVTPAPQPIPAPTPDPVVVVTPTPAPSGVINPQTKVLLEAKIADIDFVNRGLDLTTQSGIDSMKENKAFSAVSIGKYRTETGSHIDVAGANLLLGVGKDFDNSAGTLNIGGFGEFGSASHATFNDIEGETIETDGGTSYYGLGVMAEQSLANGLRVQGGVSFGKNKTDFNSDDVTDSTGKATEFDITRNYITSFAGLGYTIPVNQTSRLNMFASMKSSYMDADEQKLFGDTFIFDEVNSTRSTVGAKWLNDINETSAFYGAVAWEREFNGLASGEVHNMAISEPTLEGDTGTVGLGVNLTPNTMQNLRLSIGGKGSFGKRQGTSANAQLEYNF